LMARSQGCSDLAVLVSEDTAVRVDGAEAARVIAKLPPPPNSKVQVLHAYLCPVWRLLILWLSSEEIAVFFMPVAAKQKDSGGDGLAGDAGTASSTTPQLLRRFSILEVCTKRLDKEFSREAA